VRRATQEVAARAGRMHVSVNLSGRSLADPTLGDHIEECLRESGADPRALIFEITETEAIANMEQARRLAQRITSLGSQLALDDFGSGFASFSYLRHLPVQYLKIDGEFVRNLPSSRLDQLLVKSVVQIARGMGLQTVAEFVGDERTRAMLAEYGVDLGQGFHLGRPGPLERVVDGIAGDPERDGDGPVPARRDAVRVFHCDDSEPYRRLLAATLASHPDIEIVGAASTYTATVKAVARAQPDVVLLDLNVSDARPDIVQTLREVSPGTRVVVLSGVPEADRQPIAERADGFVSKSASPESVAAIVRWS